jgi:hypothetical protein
MNRLIFGLTAASVLLVTPAFAGGPAPVERHGGGVVFESAWQRQQEWNAYVKIHGIKRPDGTIYTPYSTKFHRGGIHCDDTGTNISPSCDIDDTTIYGGS